MFLISMAGEGAGTDRSGWSMPGGPAPKGKLVNGVGAGDSMVADSSPDGWKRRNTHMPSAWESPREAPAFFRESGYQR